MALLAFICECGNDELFMWLISRLPAGLEA